MLRNGRRLIAAMPTGFGNFCSRLLLMLGCAATVGCVNINSASIKEEQAVGAFVSLNNLQANPELRDGQIVQTEGFATVIDLHDGRTLIDLFGGRQASAQNVGGKAVCMGVDRPVLVLLRPDGLSERNLSTLRSADRHTARMIRVEGVFDSDGDKVRGGYVVVAVYETAIRQAKVLEASMEECEFVGDGQN